ncbi:3-oxoacyl-ACP synthase III family protein [Odoribacter lunatus]|uniref:3-oxoacyl-ACP synthase III family protein n=1 Tax=Odoribacter lunatus TaxID=2941335 RepID=UPI00203A5E44|nr:ketoacyl-ACP synthase III [Odoribacter lunatus]
MAIIRFNNIGIEAVAACVPKEVKSNYDLDYLIPKEEITKVIDNVGIEERRYADADVCSSDLCEKATRKLLEDNDIDPSIVDALIFVSQTSDYHQPATAPLLQHKLGLGHGCIAFDINLACSGYVYGLATAYAFASQQGIRHVLLLVGETMSKTVSQYDKVATPLFGDAGTATLIGKGDFGEAVFSLNTDGSGSDIIKMPYGGYRNPSCSEGFLNHMDSEGNIRNGEQFFMDGLDVFNFGMRVEPRDLKNLMKECEIRVDDLDLLIYHQANKFMTDFFSKRLKIPTDKTPYSLRKFGNTSSASIPLTIVSELQDKYPDRNKCILTGFGAGLSWGSVLLNLSKSKVSELIEY